ncbi:MAG TPA: hypothetical protein PKK95_05175 [Vicinamibacterales bacterium]|nr:hypothetical protein [Vicinamibacterales bacterium]
MREVGALLARYLLVMGGAAAALAAADRLPALLSGATHGARVYRTLSAAESALGARLRLPSYYPDTLSWPPSRIEVAPGPPPVTAVHVTRRDGAREALVVCQSIGAPADPPRWLLPPLEALQDVEVEVGLHQAGLVRRLTPGGLVVHDLSWTQGERRFTLRYEGAVEDLLRMARSLGGDVTP